MTICGYHDYMGEGLQRFGEGLAAALSGKARQNSRSLHDQLHHELDEIQLLTHHLEMVLVHSSDVREREVARGFLGLVYVCRFMMSDLDDIDSMQANISGFIDRNSSRLIEILKTFEAAFEKVKEHSSVMRARAAWNDVKHIG